MKTFLGYDLNKDEILETLKDVRKIFNDQIHGINLDYNEIDASHFDSVRKMACFSQSTLLKSRLPTCTARV
jgi:hypothetical protein